MNEHHDAEFDTVAEMLAVAQQAADEVTR